MPEWLIWAAVIWLFFGVMGRRSCGWGGGHARLQTGRMTSLGDDVRPGSVTSTRRLHGGHRHAAARPRETAEQRLQREFVEGRLSLDEYEAALWRELGPGTE